MKSLIITVAFQTNVIVVYKVLQCALYPSSQYHMKWALLLLYLLIKNWGSDEWLVQDHRTRGGTEAWEIAADTVMMNIPALSRVTTCRQQLPASRSTVSNSVSMWHQSQTTWGSNPGFTTSFCETSGKSNLSVQWGNNRIHLIELY